MNKFFFCIILIANLAGSAASQNTINESTAAKIDQLFDLASESTPGCMLGIMQGDTFLYTQGYGSANLEYKIPIHIHSSFNIASLSKQFTAACIALLILEGKISLDDDLKAFIPDFPEYEYDIKIKHLIYMTSGINDYYYNPRSNGTDWSSLHFFNIDTAIAASLSNESLMYEPGTQWSYSNINYMLLTKVVEQVSGMPFSVFARQRLFLPLEMNDTYVNDDIFQIIPNRVTGYNFRDAENTDWMIESGYLQRAGDGFLQINRHSPHYGGSGVYTTVSDLGKWMANFETKSFGGNAFYDLIHTTMRFAHDKTNDAFGLAFGDFNGEPIVFYAGGDWGFSSYFMRFPELGLSIVCLANLGTANTRQYVNSVVDILVGEGIIEW